MAGKIQTFVRTVRGLTDDTRYSAFEDPHGLLSFAPCKLKAYRENPYLKDIDQPCQLIGVKDGKVIGRRNSFPSRIVADGVVYDTRVSGSVYVDPAARSSLYAISLLNQALKLPDGDLNINCMLSAQNQKFYRLWGSAMFRLEEYVAGGRWNKFRKGIGYKGPKKILATAFNFCIAIANSIFEWYCWRNLPAWVVCELDYSDRKILENAAELISLDTHKFRADITPEWIEWVLLNDFDAENCCKKMLGVYDGNDLIGFALVRIDKHVKSIKVFEWQLCIKYQHLEAAFLSLIAKSLSRFAYSVKILIDENSVTTIADLNNRFCNMGYNFVVITIAKGSKYCNFEGINDSKMWRIRPGMGDAALW